MKIKTSMTPALVQLLARIDRLHPSGTIGDGCVAQLRELAARVRQDHRQELEDREWSGTTRGPGSGPMFSGDDGTPYPSCPECGGLQRPNGEFVASAVGHRSGCIIAAMLDRPTVVEPGQTGRLPL